jgi:alkylhydroperoxidase family enzyme
MDRHRAWVDALHSEVLEQPGQTEPRLRRAASDDEDVPEPLRGYVRKVARHAYKVTDEEVAALKEAGYSEDQIFEITISAAVGAAVRRLDAGLAHLGKK